MAEVPCTRLESLSNEILLDIFEYLDAYNLCHALHGLNYRINVLLRSLHLHFVCHSTMENLDIWDTLPSCFSPAQIRILSMHESIILNTELLSSDNLNLRSIRLRGAKSEHIRTMLEHLPDDNQIKSLHFIENRKFFDAKRRCISIADLLLVNHGHQFRSLVNLSLSPHRRLPTFNDIPVRFSQLRRLSLKSCPWNRELLHFLHNNTPHLRSLQVVGCWNIAEPSTEFRIEHVRELDLIYPGHMIHLQNILIHFPCLYRLHIDWQHNRWRSLINGDFLQKLFEQYLSHLKQFTFDFQEGISEDPIRPFLTNEFWLKKNIKIKLVINKKQSRYRLVKSLFSGEPWHFQYFDDLQIHCCNAS